MNKIVNVFTDGGARGNPGPAGIGIYIESGEHVEIAGIGKTIGITTNNVAEYTAVIEALEWLIQNKNTLTDVERINFFLDSNLVCSQINGIFKVKNHLLRDLLFLIHQKESVLKLPIYYSHIRRELNTKADSLVNLALDNKI